MSAAPYIRNLLSYALVVALVLVCRPLYAQDCRPGQKTTEVKCSTASKCRECIPKCKLYDGLVKRCKEVESARDTNAKALEVSEAARLLQASTIATQKADIADKDEALKLSYAERERLQREIDAQPSPVVVAGVSAAVGAFVGVVVFVLVTRAD